MNEFNQFDQTRLTADQSASHLRLPHRTRLHRGWRIYYHCGVPVQFLQPTGALVGEALAKAIVYDITGIPAGVFTAEYLAAIERQTERAKVKARLLQFIESGIIDPATFEDILTRHTLTRQWAQFQRQFLSDNL
ncbi:MAG: hypothetical protein EBU88_18730 [Acidobacteria bacterium]|nr:hypothetical protein [Acidobacteriota bacterium]